jgi:hypothetical protein
VLSIALTSAGCRQSLSVLDKLPRRYELISADELEVDFAPGKVSEYAVLAGPTSEVWAFALVKPPGDAESDARLRWSRFDGKTWSAPGEVPMGERRLVPGVLSSPPAYGALSASWSSAGEPRVVVTALQSMPRDYPPTQLVAVTRRGDAWTPPEAVTRFDVGDRRSVATLGPDAQGRTHILYTGDMDPPEFYAVAIMDGESAPKPFHVFRAGNRWQRPGPLVDRSRWAYWGGGACLDGTKLYWVLWRRYYGVLYRHAEEHALFTLEESGWHGPVRLKDGEVDSMHEASIAIDDAGRLHVLYKAFKNRRLILRYRVRDGEDWLVPSSIGRHACSGEIVNDPSGMIYAMLEYNVKDAWPGSGSRVGFVAGSQWLHAWNSRGLSIPAFLDMKWKRRLHPGHADGGGVWTSWLKDSRLHLQYWRAVDAKQAPRP